MQTAELTTSIAVLGGIAFLIFLICLALVVAVAWSAAKLQSFSYGFLRRAEQDVRERENYARELERRVFSLCEELTISSHARPMNALEKLADPRSVAAARGQAAQADLTNVAKEISQTLRQPMSSKGSVVALEPRLPGVPTPRPEGV